MGSIAENRAKIGIFGQASLLHQSHASAVSNDVRNRFGHCGFLAFSQQKQVNLSVLGSIEDRIGIGGGEALSLIVEKIR